MNASAIVDAESLARAVPAFTRTPFTAAHMHAIRAAHIADEHVDAFVDELLAKTPRTFHAADLVEFARYYPFSRLVANIGDDDDFYAVLDGVGDDARLAPGLQLISDLSLTDDVDETYERYVAAGRLDALVEYARTTPDVERLTSEKFVRAYSLARRPASYAERVAARRLFTATNRWTRVACVVAKARGDTAFADELDATLETTLRRSARARRPPRRLRL